MGGDLDDIFIVYDDDSIEPLRNQMSREKEEELIELARQVEKDDCPEELLPMNSDRLTMVEMDIDVFNEIINIQSEEIERLKQRIKVLESKQ
jgi:archaellum component FlaC